MPPTTASDSSRPTAESAPTPPPRPSLSIEAQPAEPIPAPTVGGVRLELTGDGDERPPAPVQWFEGSEPVPFGQWWSGLATGPGLPALWSQPLLLRMDAEGRADLSAPQYTTRPDGFRDADVVPAMFFEFGDEVAVRVIDHGDFHVRFQVVTPEVEATITMVQGSPFLELEGVGELVMTVPALSGLGTATAIEGVRRFSSAAGPWLFATSGVPRTQIDGDRVVVALVSGERHALGPAPIGVGDQKRYDASALAVVSEPLVDTVETLHVATDGSVRQELQQRRGTGAGAPVVWSLLPHQRDFLTGDHNPIGVMDTVRGVTPLVTARTLTMQYPAVPIVWGPTIPAGLEIAEIEIDDVPEAAGGSYFGAKYTATQATVHDVLAAAGAEEAEGHLETARAAVSALVSDGTEPQLKWEPGWGSVVVTPAEFGADSQLNDHQLQNGYWVGAAASVVVADPTQRALLIDGIDLLIADYAGASVVPGFAGVVSDQGTWSAYAGHSWASGIGGFAAGNNLESVSESSYAWWAAAKWFLATNRPELAEPFIARLTIESWLTGYDWLPTASNQSSDPTIRPWSGVVWAGKSDRGTWFDASDEAALGIRLLPIGPQSFSRYPDRAAIEAAEARWAWCDDRGDGCRERWWNLLDADAAVAGRSELAAGPEPETSTTELVRQWWRAHWENATVASGWHCSPGTTIRVDEDGAWTAIVTNPSANEQTLTCVNDDGATFRIVAPPRSAALVPVPQG